MTSDKDLSMNDFAHTVRALKRHLLLDEFLGLLNDLDGIGRFVVQSVDEDEGEITFDYRSKDPELHSQIVERLHEIWEQKDHDIWVLQDDNKQ